MGDNRMLTGLNYFMGFTAVAVAFNFILGSVYNFHFFSNIGISVTFIPITILDFYFFSSNTYFHLLSIIIIYSFICLASFMRTLYGDKPYPPNSILPLVLFLLLIGQYIDAYKAGELLIVIFYSLIGVLVAFIVYQIIIKNKNIRLSRNELKNTIFFIVLLVISLSSTSLVAIKDSKLIQDNEFCVYNGIKMPIIRIMDKGILVRAIDNELEEEMVNGKNRILFIPLDKVELIIYKELEEKEIPSAES